MLFRSVFNLRLPPLRERPQDIEQLAEHFTKKYSEANGLAAKPLSREALDRLKRHKFRGNVRELENTMHRAVLLASGDVIGPEAIILTGAGDDTADVAKTVAGIAADVVGRPPASTGDASGLVGRTVADVERDLILGTLTHCLGNRTHAANILGISIRTLRNKLKQYSQEGVAVPMPGDGERAPA